MRLAILALAGTALWGQSGLEGVRSGFLFDRPSAGVRVVEGVPGAAHLGGIVAGGLSSACVSPSGSAMIGRGEQGWTAIKNFAGGEASAIRLDGEVKRIAWSLHGRYSAILFEDRIGLLDGATLELVWEADPGPDGEVLSLAVDEGGRVWLSRFHGEFTSLEEWREGAWQELGRVGGRGLAAAGGDLAVLAGAGEVAVFRGGEPLWRALTGREDSPVGVSVAGGELVMAFGGEMPELVWIPVQGGEARRVGLDIAPERLEPFGAGEGFVLRLREKPGDEIWVAARRNGGWEAFFVPAGE